MDIISQVDKDEEAVKLVMSGKAGAKVAARG